MTRVLAATFIDATSLSFDGRFNIIGGYERLDLPTLPAIYPLHLALLLDVGSRRPKQNQEPERLFFNLLSPLGEEVLALEIHVQIDEEKRDLDRPKIVWLTCNLPPLVLTPGVYRGLVTADEGDPLTLRLIVTSSPPSSSTTAPSARQWLN